MRLNYLNYINEATLTAENIPPFQEIESLQIPHLSRTFTQVNTSPFIQIDLGEAKDIRTVIIDSGNMDGNTEITLSWSDDAFATTEGSKIMTYSETAFHTDFDTLSFRYWRLDFDSTLDDLTFGYIFIGDYITLPGIDPAAQLKYGTTSTRQLSISMQVYGDMGLNYFSSQFRLPAIMDISYTNRYGDVVASRKQIIEMFNTVQNITPIWLFIWEDDLDKFAPVFCVIDQSSIDFQSSASGLYSTTLSFLEVM